VANTGQPAQQEMGRTAPAKAKRHWTKRPTTWIGLGVVVVAGGYAAAALAVGGQAPRGTTVLGVDVGGMDATQMSAALEPVAQDVAATPVALEVSGADASTTAEVVPDQAGLSIDVPGTVDDLTAPGWNPSVLWKHAVGGGEVDPDVDVDDTALQAALQPVADSVAVAPVEGAVTFDVREDGSVEPAVTAPVDGRELDVVAAAGRVSGNWLSGQPVALEATVARTSVDAEGIEAAVDAIARPAIAGDLVVAGGGREATLAPAAFATTLAVRPVDGEAQLVADGAGLQAAVTAADPEFETAPQDARIEIVEARPTVIPAVAGRAAPDEDLSAAVVQALTGETPTRRAEVELTESEPELTTDELNSSGIVEQVSTFATNLTSDSKRTENIRIAAGYVNGTILAPGEEFSLNDTVGERTPERGFNKAPVIANGRLVDDYGGGVSQLSTTLFNNVFFAGLDELEHKPHSLYISRYPEGREATLDWRSIDNRFRNDSGHGIYIQAGIVGNQVVVSFYGTKVWNVESITSGRRNVRTPRTVYDTSANCTPNSTPHTGFTVDVTRVMMPVAGGAEQRETWTTTYNSDNRIICGPDPATQTSEPSAPVETPAG